jgi:putative DNA primase/helicase
VLDEIRNIRNKLKERELPKGADGQVKRAFNRFSLVAAAGELATMYGITGWSIGEADKGVIHCFHN